MKNVLVIAVHPDDETLGCGGTLLRHKAHGDTVHWLILTRPTEEYGFAPETAIVQNGVVQKVGSAYQFDSVSQLHFPATGLADIKQGELIKTVSQKIEEIRPAIIYIPFHSDIHGDHKTAFQAIHSCTKPFRYTFIEKIMMMETISETDQAVVNLATYFSPMVYVDVSKYIDLKLKILSLYESEIGLPPFPRSLDAIKSLARVRGAASNFKYAEAFMLLREIVR